MYARRLEADPDTPVWIYVKDWRGALPLLACG
jgi:hypothetical protein